MWCPRTVRRRRRGQRLHTMSGEAPTRKYIRERGTSHVHRKLRPSESNHTVACATPASSLCRRKGAPGRLPLLGAGRPRCDLYRVAAMLMVIEEVVDQPPIPPLVVSELCGGPAAAAAHRRRATPATICGENTCGPLAWRLDGAGLDSNREPAGHRAATPLPLEDGRVYRRDVDGWFDHLRPSSGRWVLRYTAGRRGRGALLLNRRLAAHHDGLVRHLRYRGDPGTSACTCRNGSFLSPPFQAIPVT